MPITTPVTNDELKALSDDDIQALESSVYEERQRRYNLAQAPTIIDQAIQQYQEAAGTTPVAGAEWVQPTSSLDAYPMGATVTHQGKHYESLIPANVWQPANTDDPQTARWWKDLDAQAPTPDTDGTSTTVADWSGDGKNYAVGDRVAYKGITYNVIQAHTSQSAWTPDVVPSLYQVIA